MADNKRQTFAAKAAAGVPGSAASPAGNGSPPGGTVALENALSGSIGARIRLSIGPPTPMTLEGSIFAVCHMTNIVAIDTASPNSSEASADKANAGQALAQPANIHFVPVSKIRSFELLSLTDSQQQQSPQQQLQSSQSRTATPVQSSSTPSGAPSKNAGFANAVPAIYPLDMRALNARAANAIAEAQEQERRRGKGVTKEAQDIFDAFSRTMPARWDGPNIIVADQVLITQPYRPETCKPYGPNADMNSAAIIRVRKVLEMERKKMELRSASATFGRQNNSKGNAPAQSRVNGSNHNVSGPGTPVPASTPNAGKPASTPRTGASTPTNKPAPASYVNIATAPRKGG